MSQETSPEQHLEWWYTYAAIATNDEIAALWGRLSKDERRYLWSNFTSEDRMRVRTATVNQWGNIASGGLSTVARWLIFIAMVLLFIIVFAAFF